MAAVCYQLQVLYPVVGFDSVDVVDVFLWIQAPANLAFDNPPMLFDTPLCPIGEPNLAFYVSL